MPGERVVVRLELVPQPAEVGVAGGRRVVVLPLLRVLRPRLVLRRPRHEHLPQRPDPLRAPAPAPDLLDLVVEVGLVQHPVAERLARLEPRQRPQHRLLVVLLGDARRRVAELDRLAVRAHDPERQLLADALTRARRGGHRSPSQRACSKRAATALQSTTFHHAAR